MATYKYLTFSSVRKCTCGHCVILLSGGKTNSTHQSLFPCPCYIVDELVTRPHSKKKIKDIINMFF